MIDLDISNYIQKKKDHGEELTSKSNYTFLDTDISDYGFIILRHVNSSLTNKYWIKCYNSIRNFYPQNPIVIIDDYSNYNYVSNIVLYNATIIQSEFPKHGEFLPFYYYLHNKWFNNAVILHDSVFINTFIDFGNNSSYKYIWSFKTCKQDNISDETRLIKLFEDDDLLKFYNSKIWTGCFGCMCSINHNFLKTINSNYSLDKLLNNIKSRQNRCSFERVFACLSQKTLLIPNNVISYFGNIHTYCRWGIKFNELEESSRLPVSKVWSGR
jgi:hypothetical protein